MWCLVFSVKTRENHEVNSWFGCIFIYEITDDLVSISMFRDYI